eukprot:scaffold44590_cov95-Phaeocystis_antarctica.AAC.4
MSKHGPLLRQDSHPRAHLVRVRSFLEGEQWASNRDGKPRRSSLPPHAPDPPLQCASRQRSPALLTPRQQGLKARRRRRRPSVRARTLRRSSAATSRSARLSREHSGIACGRGLTPVQELEAMPRLAWPQEASEALLGHRHPQMQTQVMIFGTPEHPVTQRCRWSRLWGL